MAELLLLAVGLAVVARFVDGKLSKRRERLDAAFRRARYATASGRRR